MIYQWHQFVCWSFSHILVFLWSLVLLTITNICSVCTKKMLIPLNSSPTPFWIWCALLVLVPLTQKKKKEEKMADTWAPKKTEAKTCGCPGPLFFKQNVKISVTSPFFMSFMSQIKTQEDSVSSPSLLVGVSWHLGIPSSSLLQLTTSVPCSQSICSTPTSSSAPSEKSFKLL